MYDKIARFELYRAHHEICFYTFYFKTWENLKLEKVLSSFFEFPAVCDDPFIPLDRPFLFRAATDLCQRFTVRRWSTRSEKLSNFISDRAESFVEWREKKGRLKAEGQKGGWIFCLQLQIENWKGRLAIEIPKIRVDGRKRRQVFCLHLWQDHLYF